MLPMALADPVISFHTPRHGPVLEVGALGGGTPLGADLAHVGMNWRF